ncbi:Iron-sulfur cluster co-chaperone protein HscB [Pseudolycoriella hygida]|uniref:Iron-sulfur cluster co-chaperone protein HscB n=1 Tax=Pseudolycoriella hygida TaxID=35572 RepID=A0A9Q0MRR1_9DIPT|nr:Iron-sulfur cluster co-chaperone protein HscB [Pseudolycoriella hygida]KAJ6635734.1 Iron-sulfur cluster co-chaperone protein HscB [Pseudolycoriella hygida]
MRRSVWNLRRFCVHNSFSFNREVEINFSSQFHNRRGFFNVPKEDRISRIKLKASRVYSDTKITKCWNCHTPLDVHSFGLKESFFCSSCGSLREVNDNYNYFELFGITEKFHVDQSELTKKFREYQSVLHPDKFGNKNETEQNLSAAISSLVNKAYKALSTPIKRAEYILKLKGITIPEENNVVDKEFLFEIMERNEEVEDANSAADLKNLLLRVNRDKEKTFCDFDVNLKRDDLIAAESSLILLRYYASLETSIKNKLSKFGVMD